MNTVTTSFFIFGLLAIAVSLGIMVRRFVPNEHVTADSKDTVKLALGLVSTTTALILGLLVSSAKGAYDTERNEVIQMAGKIAFLNRLLTMYGPEAVEARSLFVSAVEEAVRQIWPADKHIPSRMAGDIKTGNAVYAAVERLSPHDDAQRKLKEQAVSIGIELGQMRSLLVAQSVPSISTPMMVILVSWLFVIFVGFSLVAPPNPTAIVALLVSALSVSAALFLIMELDEPFGGLISISSEPMIKALNQLAQQSP